MTKFEVVLAAAIACSLLLGGCYATKQMYEGAALPRDKVAVIKNIPRMPNLTDKEVIIRSVNGRESGLYDAAVEVSPGAHELVVMCVWRGGSGLVRSLGFQQQMARVNVSVGAGKTYQIDTQTVGSCSPQLRETQ